MPGLPIASVTLRYRSFLSTKTFSLRPKNDKTIKPAVAGGVVSPSAMKKCDYCGRENRDAAVFCDGCGTLIETPQKTVPRRLTADEKKRGWAAVAVAVFCAIASSALAWSASERLHTVAGYVSTIVGTWEILRLTKLRNRKPGNDYYAMRQT
jgi:hypothetical protein